MWLCKAVIKKLAWHCICLHKILEKKHTHIASLQQDWLQHILLSFSFYGNQGCAKAATFQMCLHWFLPITFALPGQFQSNLTAVGPGTISFLQVHEKSVAAWSRGIQPHGGSCSLEELREHTSGQGSCDKTTNTCNAFLFTNTCK